MKLKPVEFEHRGLNIVLRYEDGFAPMWVAYVRWPGYKNRKYFKSYKGWGSSALPSSIKDKVMYDIDKKLEVI